MLISEVNQELLIDKLCERWVFEKMSHRLYGLLLERARLENAPDGLVGHLERFQRDEKEHEEAIEDVMRRFGRDPVTEELTPSAEMARIECAALLEACRRKDVSLSSMLGVLLAAESADNAAWDLLEELCKTAGIDEDVLRQFRSFQRQEKEHLHVVKESLLTRQRDELRLPDQPHAT
jgi:rubrerythrin